MFPQDKDLILQETVKLYNNIAKLENCEGRLLAELEIYPTPRIIWEFEILGNAQCNLPHSSCLRSEPLNPLKGYFFSINKPVCSSYSYTIIGSVRTLRGTAAQALYGTLENEAHLFTFYLPNTRLQQISINQGKLLKSIKDLRTGDEIELEEEGRYIRSSINNIWSLGLMKLYCGELVTVASTLIAHNYGLRLYIHKKNAKGQNRNAKKIKA